MNHRVLELLKAPKNIQSEDLNLLKEEINSFPYVQNIRALYLYGVHLYDKENYQRVLSVTAAYTTDKKILYQLINGKIKQQPKPEVKQETVKERHLPAENPLQVLYQAKAGSFPIKRDNPAVAEPETAEDSRQQAAEKQQQEETRIQPPPREEIKPIYVEGARNRILFEGEENFLNDDTVETIDLESTLESGSIVTQKIEQKEEQTAPEENNQEENASAETDEVQPVGKAEEFVPETAHEGEKISAESEEKNIPDDPAADSQKAEDTAEHIRNNDSGTENPEEKVPGSESPEEIQAEGTSEFTPETIIEEEKINAEPEKEKISDGSSLSFHETEAFLPEVRVSNNETGEENQPVGEAENADLNSIPDIAEFTPEKIINEDKISSEKVEKAVQDESELSFHGTESFLPEVKIQSGDQEVMEKAPQPNLSKHEDEMRRLIEEVERKMKEKASSEENKKDRQQEGPEDTGHDISFAETQDFEVKSAEPEQPEIKEKEAESETAGESGAELKEEAAPGPAEKPAEIGTQEAGAWKPMSFDTNIPDSLINKPAETPQPVTEEQPKEKDIQEEAQHEESETEENPDPEETAPENHQEDAEQAVKENEAMMPEETVEDVPVMNVSFFGSGWSIPQPERKEIKEETVEEINEEKDAGIPVSKTSESSQAGIPDSNIPGFINTWQSWLKIDRTEETDKEKSELKNKVIESFIENNPRISQLKDESSFVVKEKGDDISHLMTETLANLYFEQKLYTKAIKAFETLIRKSPEKKKYYEGKIQEIKDFRTKG